MQLYMKKKKDEWNEFSLLFLFLFLPSPNQAQVSKVYGKTEYSKTGRYTTHK